MSTNYVTLTTYPMYFHLSDQQNILYNSIYYIITHLSTLLCSVASEKPEIQSYYTEAPPSPTDLVYNHNRVYRDSSSPVPHADRRASIITAYTSTPTSRRVRENMGRRHTLGSETIAPARLFMGSIDFNQLSSKTSTTTTSTTLEQTSGCTTPTSEVTLTQRLTNMIRQKELEEEGLEEVFVDAVEHPEDGNNPLPARYSVPNRLTLNLNKELPPTPPFFEGARRFLLKRTSSLFSLPVSFGETDDELFATRSYNVSRLYIYSYFLIVL